MNLETLSVVACVLAGIPAVMFVVNLYFYLRPTSEDPSEPPCISVLIPARDEERNIGAAVESVLDNEGVELEVLVLDDNSQDATAEIVRQMAESDARVRLLEAPPLSPGWNGKHHACNALWEEASHPLLVFMDADVRLDPRALLGVSGFLERQGADLVSGFPAEVTETWSEKLVIPLLQFILLGFLPIWWMRRSGHPMFAAGCGQFFMIRREAYAQTGGHGAIKDSRADGLTLPRLFRKAGLTTDIFDGTDVMRCRMYGTFGEVWNGIAKNATEELGAPGRIVPFTILLIGGQVLPFVLLPVLLLGGYGSPATMACVAAIAMSMAVRLIAVRRFDQSLSGALLHPVGVSILMAIQWYALASSLLGRPARWKGREYPGGNARGT
jgi:hypothetical protein